MYPVTFVSLGPGDPELITMKALKALQAADCIFYPSTQSKDGTESSRARDILDVYHLPQTALHSFHVPMSKNREAAIEAYRQVSIEVEEMYNDNKRVAVVAEGDAGFYSSIHYIYDNLSAKQIPIQLVAGVPAFIACGALAGIHIVKQEEELHVVPGTISPDDLLQRLDDGKVIVIMKVSQCEAAVKQAIEARPDVFFHYFENAGVDGKEYYTHDGQAILERKFPYFSIIIMHK